MRAGILFVILAGCGRFGFGEVAPSGDGGTADAMKLADGAGPDATPDAAPGSFCAGTYVHVCIPSAPTLPVSLSGVVSTDNATACVMSAGTCVIAGTSITVVGAVRANGTVPLVLLSSGAITVIGTSTIDVSAGGPNSNPAPCTKTLPTAGGGGAGGSLVGAGGDGGNQGTVTNGGIAGPATAAPPLRGGCNGSSGVGGGIEGDGGGAIVLIANGAITIDGAITAAGGAGQGGAIDSGGGGGGSGGVIALDAPMIDISPTGRLIAQGGGGGGGGNATLGGRDGAMPSTVGAAAPGGAGADSTAGDGGAGGVIGNGTNGLNNQPPGASGAGGGGGGTGYIHATTNPILQGVVSPPFG